jgi:pSer/pThr/pTyr-binding forkhead associated (FHA) protein
MRCVLTVEEDGEPKRHEFRDRIVVGRDFDCDIVLTNRSVSRKHAAFEPAGSGWVLKDLQSINGTFVKNARIKEALVTSGEHVRFGDVKGVFEIMSSAEMSSAGKLLQTLSVAPTKKARPVAAVVVAVIAAAILVGVTIWQKNCAPSGPETAPRPAATPSR